MSACFSAGLLGQPAAALPAGRTGWASAATGPASRASARHGSPLVSAPASRGHRAGSRCRERHLLCRPRPWFKSEACKGERLQQGL